MSGKCALHGMLLKYSANARSSIARAAGGMLNRCNRPCIPARSFLAVIAYRSPRNRSNSPRCAGFSEPADWRNALILPRRTKRSAFKSLTGAGACFGARLREGIPWRGEVELPCARTSRYPPRPLLRGMTIFWDECFLFYKHSFAFSDSVCALPLWCSPVKHRGLSSL